MEEFATVVDTPFQTSPRLKEVAAKFVCRLYSNDSNDDIDVDLVRMKVFSQKTRDVERIPPTTDALDQHLKRSVFQASIWTTAHIGRWCLWTTPLIMGGRKRKASCFPYGPRCPSPGMYSTWMWSALAQVRALSASAWRQNWNGHVFASIRVRSSWTRTICNT